jgi:hypothetical protein
MEEGGMVFPGGAKEGGVFVEGELGMPIMNSITRTSHTFWTEFNTVFHGMVTR